ncbi:MAG: S8 family serine peptidase [Burkholderiales bacterium]
MNSFKRLFPFVLVLLSACGGGGGEGGGGGNGGGNPPPANSQVLGTLKVASTNKLEREPNNTVAASQAINPGDSIVGDAGAADPGYQGINGRPTATLQDLYRITITTENVRIVLTMAQGDSSANDLDLFLLNDTGANIVTTSEGVDQLTETVTTPSPGTYIVGVRGFKGKSGYLLSAGTTTTSSAFDRETSPVGAQFVPRELLVKYKNSVSIESQALKHNLAPMRHVWNEAYLMKLATLYRALAVTKGGPEKVNGPGHEENEAVAATLEALRKLRKDPTIDYAEPNYIRHAAAVPSDEFYKFQWHYPAINLPEAWDIATTRGANTIIAVIDTGILSQHPDLKNQLVSGYDFISDPTNAADNDGRDANPEDPGDGLRAGESSYHGTHVAGTIAAETNTDGKGVAGIAWNAKIMPLRVLGTKGGTDVDIIEAIKFAARLDTAPIPSPPVKADVINMSLGGAGRSQTTQDVITNARAAGVIIVAAAGNDNSSELFYPASYDGVISVSAVTYDLKRAPYSNFGTKIDIAAPGGDTSADLNGDGFADGILSTLKDDSSTPARFNYVFYQGTSMASPHIAGVIALMRGLNPGLTPEDVDQLIEGSHPLYSGRITTDLGETGRDNIFGHGLIDASKAVTAAKSLAGNTTPTGSNLALSASNLDYDSFLDHLSVSVSNGGGGTLNIISITTDQPWLKVTPTSGVAPLQLDVSVKRAGLADGNHNGNITVTSDAESGAKSKTIPVTLRVSSSAATGDVGTVFVLLIDPVSGNTIKQDETQASEGYRFGFSGITPGNYDLFAGTDRDNDGFICDIEDACGTIGGLLTIHATGQVTGVDFPINNAQNQPQALLKRKDDSRKPLKQLR